LIDEITSLKKKFLIISSSLLITKKDQKHEREKILQTTRLFLSHIDEKLKMQQKTLLVHLKLHVMNEQND
jgi:hypothetical protein